MDLHTSSSADEKKIIEQVKEHQKHKQLTSSELGDLFANYLGDSLHVCFFEHALQVVEDKEIKDFLLFAKNLANKHVQFIKGLYSKENIPIPIGFGEQDIGKDAPRLFSDIFMLIYITQMTKSGLSLYSSALTTATRQDVVDYLRKCVNETMETYERGLHLLLSKGMDIATPNIPYPKETDFVEKESFIGVISGKVRPLTALEIKHLQININTNILGKALMMAYSQVASSSELRKYFREGVELANKQILQLSEYLTDDNMPVPKTLDVHISDSTNSPFSDKLLLFHAGLSNAYGVENYGTAISKILRHDIAAKFTTLSAGIAKYADDGLNITIEKGWLEEPPTSADRKKVSKDSSENMLH